MTTHTNKLNLHVADDAFAVHAKVALFALPVHGSALFHEGPPRAADVSENHVSEASLMDRKGWRGQEVKERGLWMERG